MLKTLGFVAILFFAPLLIAGLLALPLYMAHQYRFISIAIYAGEIGGVLLFLYRWRSAVDFGLTLAFSWSDIFWCLLYVAARTLTWLLLVPIVAIQTNWLLLLGQCSFFLLLNAPGEELHFRGLLFSSISRRLSQKMSPRKSMLIAAGISSLLFGLLHFFTIPSVMWLLVFTADGLAFATLRIQSGTLFIPLMAHGLVNVLTGAVFVSAAIVADNVALTYQIALIVIDLLFFVILINQHQRPVQATPALKRQAALE